MNTRYIDPSVIVDGPDINQIRNDLAKSEKNIAHLVDQLAYYKTRYIYENRNNMHWDRDLFKAEMGYEIEQLKYEILGELE